MARKRKITGGDLLKFTEPGQTFIGTLLRLKDQTTRMGESIVAEFATEDGEVKALFLSTVLVDTFTEALVNKKVEIVYKGKEKTSGGTEVKLFDVYEFVDEE